MIRRTCGWALAACSLAAVAWALAHLPEPSASLAADARQALEQSGVSHPVTAVLLSYRGYDTLLEVGVLLLSVVAVWSLRQARVSTFARPAGPLLESLLRYLLPLLALTGVYLLWIGAFRPGGAFQGGALLGGAIVLTLLGGLAGRRLGDRQGVLRAGLWIGLASFISVGLVVMIPGGRFLEYRNGQAGALILLIEAAALISIGLTLGCLFYGGRPVAGRGSQRISKQ